MTNFRNKSGFSLLEIVVAMGLATGVMIFLMKMQAESTKNTKTATVNQAVETFFSDFKATIDRPGFCGKSFENMSLANNSSQTINEIKNPLGQIRYTVGVTYETNMVKLNSITLKNFVPDDQEGLEGIATLDITLEKMGKIYGGKTITKQMEVSVSRNQTNKILDCGALSSGGVSTPPPTPAPVVPPPPTATTPESSSNEPAAATPTASTTTPSHPAADESKAQEAALKALQNSSEMKQLQEMVKQQLQQQNANEIDSE